MATNQVAGITQSGVFEATVIRMLEDNCSSVELKHQLQALDRRLQERIAGGKHEKLARLQKATEQSNVEGITSSASWLAGYLSSSPSDRKSTRLNSSNYCATRMTSSHGKK